VRAVVEVARPARSNGCGDPPPAIRLDDPRQFQLVHDLGSSVGAIHPDRDLVRVSCPLYLPELVN
jgi:hypothetical protein